MSCAHIRGLLWSGSTTVAPTQMLSCCFICGDTNVETTSKPRGPVVPNLTEPDPDTGARYLQLRTDPIHRTVKLSDTVLIDLDRFGNCIGVEILK